LRHLRKDLDINTLKKVLEEGEVYRRLRLLKAYLQVLLEAYEEQFKEVRAMINSPAIERILKESGWIDKIRKQDQQVWEEKLQKVEAERQMAEAEIAELRERLRLLQQAQAKPALNVPEQQRTV
ncbi:MAG: hypothetical protein LBU17_03825, partial [Treponema sp.]|nr:hypothetical protein [Treponema sp.]